MDRAAQMSENGQQESPILIIVSEREKANSDNQMRSAMKNHETRKHHVGKRMASPVGTLTLAATNEGLAAILWENDRPNRVRLRVMAEDDSHPVLVETERQLTEYFAGRRTQFALTLDLEGTAFQHAVWNALLTIPFGETRSYAGIARQIGRPAAVRAVGAANGRNPVSIVTPCHRVIGSSGALTGFAGGLDVKMRLLEFEKDAVAGVVRPRLAALGTELGVDHSPR